mgnify:CR=1 FL=1
MVALAEGGAAYRKRPAVSSVEPTCAEIVGAALLASDWHASILRAYMGTRDGRGALPEFQEGVEDAQVARAKKRQRRRRK